MKEIVVVGLGAAAVMAGATVAAAAGLPPSTVPGSPPGFNYPLSYDSTTADPKNHHVIYEDRHVRVLEVTLWPHDTEKMHGHAYPSVFALDDIQPKMTNVQLVPQTIAPFGTRYANPGAPAYPVCTSMAPQPPHAVTIQEPYPQHFYRIEFKHLDPEGFAANWRRTYPELAHVATLPGVAATTTNFSAAWPYPISYETVRAAPGNYKILYESPHIRLIEVSLAPGATEPMNGSPYTAINAYDAPAPGTPGGARIEDRELDGASPLLGHAVLRGATPPPTLTAPTCTVSGPVPPHQWTNLDRFPIHYYRFEYLRLDGAGFASRWKEWFPIMAEGPRE